MVNRLGSRSVAYVFFAAFVTILIVVAAYAYLRPHTDALLACVLTDDPNGATMSKPCVAATVDRLLAVRSAKSVMSYITDPATPLVVLKNCHGIAHMVGESEYRRTQSVERALGNCSASCAGGCIHGVIETAILDEFGDPIEAEAAAHDVAILMQSGSKYCSVAELCHGVGHIMFKSFGTYKKSLDGCGSIADDMNAERCYEGVFMESLGDESSFGFPRAPDAARFPNDYAYPCAEQPEKYRLACFRYLAVFQDALFVLNEVSAPSDKIEIQRRVCNSFAPSDKQKCIYGAAASVTARVYNGNFERVGLFCDTYFPEPPDHASCVMGIVTNWTQFNEDSKTLDYCAIQKEGASRSDCYMVAFELMNRRDNGTYEHSCRAVRDSVLCETERSRFTQAAAQAIERKQIGAAI